MDSGEEGDSVSVSACLSVKDLQVWCKLSVCLHISFIHPFIVCSDLQVLERGLEKVLVLEDDVRFEPRFKRRLQAIMDDIDRAQLDWDLM